MWSSTSRSLPAGGISARPGLMAFTIGSSVRGPQLPHNGRKELLIPRRQVTGLKMKQFRGYVAQLDKGIMPLRRFAVVQLHPLVTASAYDNELTPDVSGDQRC